MIYLLWVLSRSLSNTSRAVSAVLKALCVCLLLPLKTAGKQSMSSCVFPVIITSSSCTYCCFVSEPRLICGKDRLRVCLSLLNARGLAVCYISMLLPTPFYSNCNRSTRQHLDVVCVWATEEGGPPLCPKAPDDSDSSIAGRLIVCGAGMRRE